MTRKAASTGSSLPAAVQASARAQLPLSAPLVMATSLPDGEPWAAVYRYKSGYLARFIDLVDFDISSAGTEITIYAVPGVCTQTIEHLYQNQALPLALSLKKRLVLHGSAVEIGGKAAAFVAESGRGKSTLAASFSSSGFRFLTDDGLLVEPMDDHEYVIQPSHASLRLWDDSYEAISHLTMKTEPAISYTSKVRVLAGENLPFCAQDRVLKHLYILGAGTSKGVSITPVSSQDSFIEMRRHCFLLSIDEHEMLAHNFRQLADLSRLPIFFKLDYPRRYDMLPQVRAAVVEHMLLGDKRSSLAS